MKTIKVLSFSLRKSIYMYIYIILIGSLELLLKLNREASLFLAFQKRLISHPYFMVSVLLECYRNKERSGNGLTRK